MALVVHQQGPGQPPVPSIGEALRTLSKSIWREWRRLGRRSQVILVGLVLVAFALHSCSGNQTSKAETAIATPGSLSVSPSTPLPPAPMLSVETGSVPVDDNRLITEIEAEKYTRWLDELADLEIDGESLPGAIDTVSRLADSYGGKANMSNLLLSIPGEGSRVHSALTTAARELNAGEKALRKKRYDDADTAFKRATQALADLRSAARSDLLAIESTNALRLSRNGAVSDAASTESTTVIAWVDGDTVDTDQGRVRVLGVNTPEMHEQCRPAQAARDAASRLAPVGQRVRLINPASVSDTDKYGRLLRYVYVTEGASASGGTIDVGYSLLLNSLAEPRYDSQDGYQWHPRETAYRLTNARPATGAACPPATEKDVFVLASTLATIKSDDEYGRHQIISDVIAHPYRSAAKNLTKYVTSVRKDDEEVKAEKAAEKRAQRARRQELARQRLSSSSSSDAGSSSNGSSSGGGGNSGYTGPRCYAPGGKTWKPC